MARAPADTPLMRQYLEAKERYPDAILFFRLGDFYEMFFEDAVYVAGALELTLTTRDRGRDDAVPMCGVPHHAARHYIVKLLALGHKVALCEQVEDPKVAKGIVRREVTRVITPGVILDEEQLEAKANHYLAAVTGEGERFGVAFLDVSTGDFLATSVDGLGALLAEIVRMEPREVVGQPPEALKARYPSAAYSVAVPPAGAQGQAILQALADPLARAAAAAAYAYASGTQLGGALPIVRIVPYQGSEFLVLDDATKANLELFQTLREQQKRGSLLGVLDATCTAPGGRLLRNWLAFPLRDVAQIRRRQDGIELLIECAALRQSLRDELTKIRDIARLTARATVGVATPRDLAGLRASLAVLPALWRALRAELATRLDAPALLVPPDDELADITADLAATLVDDPPLATKDGGFIRREVSPELSELVSIASGGKERILAIESRERERTGIGSLKIKYNRVFGYYLEVTRSNLAAVPADYIRKQTLAGAERFITPELAEYESKVLSADERRVSLEGELFAQLRQRIAAVSSRLLAAAERVALLDVLASLADVAHKGGYARPVVDTADRLSIEDGRHPVVEQLAAAGGFVPNDTRLDPASEQMLVITGPNMAGKSTVLRQVALIQLMAQMGSFVPARAAELGLCDQIFTRVGASDNLARGESTFMVEMRETAHILAHATRHSLVVLDEIGRGTSTYDGVSIAWAVAEFLHDHVGCKTLFATHYHELCALSQARPRVRNMSVAVKEWRGEIVFLRKLVGGGASRSYGIEVARLAGLPREVLRRARELLGRLEQNGPGPVSEQMSLFAAAGPPPLATESHEPAPTPPAEPHPVLAALGRLEPDRMTPLEALALLDELRRQL